VTRRPAVTSRVQVRGRRERRVVRSIGGSPMQSAGAGGAGSVTAV
jgi:hypothetical protein